MTLAIILCALAALAVVWATTQQPPPWSPA